MSLMLTGLTLADGRQIPVTTTAHTVVAQNTIAKTIRKIDIEIFRKPSKPGTTIADALTSAAVIESGNEITFTVLAIDITQQLAWINNQGGNGAIYDIIINNDISIRPTTVSTRGRNVTINIRSANPESPRTIELRGQGHLFEVDSNITLVLQDIVLQGHSNNNAALVFIGSGGKMILNSGSKITGNINTSNTARGGGIHLDGGGLELSDGAEIIGNIVRGGSGADPHLGQFGAWDGQGGGIFAGNRSTVAIRGGLISDNKTDTVGGSYGGGIFIIGGSTVTMTGGVISRNSSTVGLGGHRYGGGVFIFDSTSTFTKRAVSGSSNSGIIHGSTGSNANTATDGGHAIFRYFGNLRQRNTTLGPYDEISTSSNSGWEQ